jgi:hypothetical protein
LAADLPFAACGAQRGLCSQVADDGRREVPRFLPRGARHAEPRKFESGSVPRSRARPASRGKRGAVVGGGRVPDAWKWDAFELARWAWVWLSPLTCKTATCQPNPRGWWRFDTTYVSWRYTALESGPKRAVLQVTSLPSEPNATPPAASGRERETTAGSCDRHTARPAIHSLAPAARSASGLAGMGRARVIRLRVQPSRESPLSRAGSRSGSGWCRRRRRTTPRTPPP